MERENGGKALRVLSMYQKLMNNQIVNKAEEAAAYNVNRSLRNSIFRAGNANRHIAVE